MNTADSGDRRCILASGAIDGTGVSWSPVRMRLRGGSIESIDESDVAGPDDETVVDLPGHLIIPALVNAHAHLDLTLIGPRPYGGDFMEWIHEIVQLRRATDDLGVARAVARGAELSRRGGTGLIGDIAGGASVTAVEALRASGLGGVSYFEVFGQGASQADGIEKLRHAAATIDRESRGVRLGLSPHTPFSCGMDLYRAATSFDLPLCTHLAETLDELEFVRSATGPFATLLKQLGVWDASIQPTGRHAVDEVLDALDGRDVLAAHLNYIENDHLARLATCHVSVAYCPRASAYFGHPLNGRAPHRYREMIDAGVNVALGTDSIICLDTPDRISVLDEMRFLHLRDGTDPVTLLRMATINGARALGFEDGLVQLEPGASAGLLELRCDGASAPEMLESALARDDAPKWAMEPAGQDEA